MPYIQLLNDLDSCNLQALIQGMLEMETLVKVGVLKIIMGQSIPSLLAPSCQW